MTHRTALTSGPIAEQLSQLFRICSVAEFIRILFFVRCHATVEYTSHNVALSSATTTRDPFFFVPSTGGVGDMFSKGHQWRTRHVSSVDWWSLRHVFYGSLWRFIASSSHSTTKESQRQRTVFKSLENKRRAQLALLIERFLFDNQQPMPEHRPAFATRKTGGGESKQTTHRRAASINWPVQSASQFPRQNVRKPEGANGPDDQREMPSVTL